MKDNGTAWRTEVGCHAAWMEGTEFTQAPGCTPTMALPYLMTDTQSVQYSYIQGWRICSEVTDEVVRDVGRALTVLFSDDSEDSFYWWWVCPACADGLVERYKVLEWERRLQAEAGVPSE